MEDRDFEDEMPVDIRTTVARYEEMVNFQKSHFFDVNTFEHIANYYEQKEEWRKALQVLDYAIEQHSYSSLFLIKKAGLLIYYRKFSEALTLLDKADILDPGDTSIVVLRSDVYVEKGQHDYAAKIIEDAIEKNSDNLEREELYLELADVY